MKTLFLSIFSLFVFTLVGTNVNAQSESNSKFDTLRFEVDGVCGMCKSRIELAVYDMKHVKTVDWDGDSGQLETVVKSGKLTAEDVAKKVASIGHSSELMEADKKAYAELPDCCKYADGVKKHGFDRR